YYLNDDELRETLEEAYLNALDEASLEVAEGRYEPEEIEAKINSVIMVVIFVHPIILFFTEYLL
ncbi:MAG: hypothetical protein AB4063_18010, partial [Crocosphaera sp.]